MATETNGEASGKAHHYEEAAEVPKNIVKFDSQLISSPTYGLTFSADIGSNDTVYGPNMMKESG
jgi:hypothetical protein